MTKKHIVVGISGGIAAYKTLTLIRLFVKNGYEVKVVATAHALQFVTPLTIETLSNNKLYVDMFEVNQERTTTHIALSQWADVCVLAPATANLIGKIANGIADDALSTTLLAMNKPVFFAPAMNENMLNHFAVEQNIKTLKNNGYIEIQPQEGFLACRQNGKGRMAEPEEIFKIVDAYCNSTNKGSGFKALVTAGGTREPIDAVRYIGNSSTGLMGVCIAEALANSGVEVELVMGPSSLQTENPNIHRTNVQTATQMFEACQTKVDSVDIVIMSAAVADYTPMYKFDKKLKKQEQNLQIQLQPTVDILKTLAINKKDNQIFVGFALETDNEITNAQHKLHTKNLDFIVLNSLNDKGAGFETATNKVYIIDKNDTIEELPLQLKQDVAQHIVKRVIEAYQQRLKTK
ncbi:MAG: bifunctional phosphopantothenoylcysteine decarboxylase/phosphopantothenate--cysteine ligase CoaBC [Bacteroidales bacterium]|nr:bifunctional phosphopantothenoylcysteine decarboxylase/phosphopantothenate--cysteine ligase CoaBC [Bacteroidales bacterium]